MAAVSLTAHNTSQENGIPSCANGWLLNDVLRERWGRHDAVVTTDSGAIGNLRGDPANAPSDAVAAAWALNNGTDVSVLLLRRVPRCGALHAS